MLQAAPTLPVEKDRNDTDREKNIDKEKDIDALAGPADPGGDVGARLGALESLGALLHFIGGELRLDLTRGAGGAQGADRQVEDATGAHDTPHEGA